MSQIKVTELVLRDAHQCLLATRLRTEDMLPICPQLDRVGYWALEVWGGATYDSCLRFLKEDPWQRLRQLREALPHSPLSMLLRGQNIVGYRHYADDVVNKFVELAANNGIDVFRVFDALNDMRNLESSIKAIKKNKKHAQGAICYTVSPVHDIQQQINLAKQFESMGCDSIAIKDMAGLLVPEKSAELFAALKDAVNIPLHCHTHSTAGVAALSLMKAIENGCAHIDTAISSLAEGASHTATEAMVVALQDTPYDTGLDLSLLAEIAEHFRHVRKKYHQFEGETQLDPRVHINQIPGGMISNLHNQLREQNALDKLDAVNQEIPRVRKDLGYPPLVTPSSQIVGTQAVLNVLTGERYKSITNEVKWYCQGKYGKPPAKIDPAVLKKAIGDTPVISGRPADELEDELQSIPEDVKALCQSEEDEISYILFPDIATTFFNERQQGTLKPEPLEPIITSQEAPTEFDIILHGESYHIQFTGVGHHHQGARPYYLTVDGQPEEVFVSDDQAEPVISASGRPKASEPGHVTVAMPSTIAAILVKVDDEVSAGTPLLVAEAMKMETEVQAPIDGKIFAVHIKKGDAVNPDEILMEIR